MHLPINRSLVRAAIVGAGLLAVAACSSPPVPTDTFYNLTISAPSTSAGGSIDGIAEVPPFRAEGVINERPIVYRESANTQKQYTYHYWSEPPAIMLQRGLVDSLRSVALFDQVTSPEVRANRDYEVVGTLRRLEHVVGSWPGKVVVEFELGLRRIRGNDALFVKTYTAERNAGRGVASAVSALSDAISDLFAEAARDMATLGN